jgi:hypothetical protein
MSKDIIDDFDKDIYIDPNDEDMKKVLKELEGLGDHSKIQELIIKTYPSWLIHSTNRYSKDYPHLEQNWGIICEKTGVQKQSIVIVDEIIKDNDHLLINIFCERMTREGFVVRRKGEFIGCSECGGAIPSEIAYKHMKAVGVPIPDEWSEKCSSC